MRCDLSSHDQSPHRVYDSAASFQPPATRRHMIRLPFNLHQSKVWAYTWAQNADRVKVSAWPTCCVRSSATYTLSLNLPRQLQANTSTLDCGSAFSAKQNTQEPRGKTVTFPTTIALPCERCHRRTRFARRSSCERALTTILGSDQNTAGDQLHARANGIGRFEAALMHGIMAEGLEPITFTLSRGHSPSLSLGR